MVLTRIDKAGINLHNGRELISEDNIKFFIERSGELICVMPERYIVLYAIERASFSWLQAGSIDCYTIMVFDALVFAFIFFGYVRVRHTGIRQASDNGDAVSPFNKLLTYVRSVKRLRPIVLTNNEYLH